MASNDSRPQEALDSEQSRDDDSIDVGLRPAGDPCLCSHADVAIAIRNFPQPYDSRQMHVGIYGLDEDKAACMVHQPWDHRPLCERDVEELNLYSWVPALRVESSIVREQFLDHCLNLVEQNPHGIPYGICYGEGEEYFDSDGNFLGKDGAAGLTCATFVLELFRSYGFNIVARHTWVERPDDKEWAERVFSGLIRSVGPAITDRLRSQLEKFKLMPMRFRPEEVAAAGALFDGKPLPMHVATFHGQKIVDAICGQQIAPAAPIPHR